MNNYVLITPSSCAVLDSKAIEVCLPQKQICFATPTDTLTVECGKEWNCNRCSSDGEYLQPFIRGEKIQIQTLFYDAFNTDRTEPTDGFGSFVMVEFCGDVTTTTMDLSAFSSRQMVAWGCGKSYQIIEIDTSLFTDCRFKLKFTTFDSNGNQVEEICTQEFGEVMEKEATVLIKGKQSGKDCFGYCYDMPDSYTGDLIEYDNSLRFYGYYKINPSSFSKTRISNGIISKTSIQQSYTFQLGRRIPPFASRILDQLLTAGTVCIDGEDLQIDSAAPSNQIESGRMLLYSVNLFKECETIKGCD